jgi:hypothetical protein
MEETSLFHGKTSISISNSSVGWHIEHSLKVIIQVAQALEKSNPDTYKWQFNTNKFLIFIINRIPRGKAKAPKVVVPEGDVTTEALTQSFEKVRIATTKFEKLKPNNYFKHPYLGNLNLKSTTKFLSIHTNHHFKIINDIIKAS